MKKTVNEINRLSKHQNFFVFIIACIAMIGVILVLFLTPQAQAEEVIDIWTFNDTDLYNSYINDYAFDSGDSRSSTSEITGAGATDLLNASAQGVVNNLSNEISASGYSFSLWYKIDSQTTGGTWFDVGWNGTTQKHFNFKLDYNNITEWPIPVPTGGCDSQTNVESFNMTGGTWYWIVVDVFPTYSEVYINNSRVMTCNFNNTLTLDDVYGISFYDDNGLAWISDLAFYDGILTSENRTAIYESDETVSQYEFETSDDYAMYYGLNPLELEANNYKRIPFVFNVCDYDNSQGLNYEARLLDDDFNLINEQVVQLDDCSGTSNLSYFTDEVGLHFFHVGIYETDSVSASIVDTQDFDVVVSSGLYSIPTGELLKNLFASPLEVNIDDYSTTTIPFIFSYCDGNKFDDLDNPEVCVENYELGVKLDYCVEMDSCSDSYGEIDNFPLASLGQLSPDLRLVLYNIATTTTRIFSSSDIFQILTFTTPSSSTTSTTTSLTITEEDGYFTRKVKVFLTKLMSIPPFSFIYNFQAIFNDRINYWTDEIVSFFTISVVLADTHYMGAMPVPMDGAGFQIDLPFDYLDTENDVSFTFLSQSDLVDLVGQSTINMFRGLTSVIVYSFLFFYLIRRLKSLKLF